MKKNIRAYILIIGISLILLVFTIGTLLKEDVLFSENENRYLNTKPSFSISNVLNGKYERDLENYLNDQILFRNYHIRACSNFQNIIGISDINDVYICDNGRIIQKIVNVDFDNVNKNIERIDRLSKYNLRVIVVPSAGYILRSELPRKAYYFNEDEVFNLLNEKFYDRFIDLRSAYSIGFDSLYYYTDHHWTNEGVRICYGKFIGDYFDYEKVTLSNDFKGSLYSKVLIGDRLDKIETLSSAINDKYDITIGDKKYDSLIFNEYLDKKDKYRAFLGGNYPLVNIRNDKVNNDKSILLIKDSFANSFVPYLTLDYENVYLIDTRYFKESIINFIEKENIDEVLVLYGMEDFVESNIVIN